MKKIYKCTKCGEILDYKPVRLSPYRYNDPSNQNCKSINYCKYKSYVRYGENIDLCKRCYLIFDRWINNRK